MYVSFQGRIQLLEPPLSFVSEESQNLIFWQFQPLESEILVFGFGGSVPDKNFSGLEICMISYSILDS